MIIDSHCHLNYLKLEDDLNLDNIISNAKTQGVDKIITIAVAWEELQDVERIANNFEDVFYSVGVHPSEIADKKYSPSVEEIVYISNNKKCVAIGETGLDYHYNDSKTFISQKDAFARHIQAGIEVDKPVIVHTRSAKEDTLDILKAENIYKCGGVLHCFTEDYTMAKKALDMGMYISFSGILTFKNAQKIQYAAKQIPLDRVLIETDAPYLAPVPKRGRTNYPEYIHYTAEFLANLRNEDLDRVCKQTYKNTKKLFGL